MKRLLTITLIFLSFCAIAQTSVLNNNITALTGTGSYTGTYTATGTMNNGLTIKVEFSGTNAGAATLVLTTSSGVQSSKAIVDSEGNALTGGEISAGESGYITYKSASNHFRLEPGFTSSSTNIYNSDGTLTGNRAVNGGGNFLEFVNLSSLNLQAEDGIFKAPAGGVGFNYSTTSGFGTATMAGRHTNDNNTQLTLGTPTWNFFDGRTVPRGLVYAGDYSATFGDSSAVSKKYTDAKVADAITDGVTTIAPSQNSVFDALALKAPLISPVFTTPNIGNATGNISGNAATVTTNANLTGPVTSVGNATTIANSINLPVSPTTTTQPANTSNTTIATTAYVDTKETTKRLGDIFNTTFDASSGSLYTDTSPASTFTFTSGGLTTSGTPADYLNYVTYTSYYTDAHSNKRVIRFFGNTDGDGIAFGWLAPSNVAIVGRITMTGGSKGQLQIQNYFPGSVVTTNRATSTTNLSYTNTTDMIEMALIRSGENWTLTATVIDQGTGLPTGTSVSVTYTDPLTGTSTSGRAAQSVIYHRGGTQTIISDRYAVDNVVQREVLFYGNSIMVGVASAGVDNAASSILSQTIPGGVNLVGGGGTQTADYLLLKDELFSLQPRIFIFENGVNDVITSVSAATTQTNILQFIADCRANNVIPILSEVLPISASFGGGSNATFQAAIVALNAWMNALGNVTVVPASAVIKSGASMAAQFDSGDGIHLNAIGQEAYMNIIVQTLKNYTQTLQPVRISSIINNSSTATITTKIGRPHNGLDEFVIENTNTGTLAGAGIRAVDGTINTYVTSYSSGHTALTGYANKSFFGGGGTGGLILGAIDGSGHIDFITGSTTLSTNTRGNISSAGRWKIGDSNAATAILHLIAGTATASTAPLKFTSGTNNTTAETGAMEYNGTNLLFTPVGTNRLTVFTGYMGQATLVAGTVAVTTNGVAAGSSCIVTLNTPNTVTLTTQYQCTCTTNTITIQANVAAGTINTADVSVMNYMVKP